MKDRESVRFFIWITLTALVVALMASYVVNTRGYGPTHAQSPLPTSTWTPIPLPPTPTNTPLPPTPTNTPMPPNTPPAVTADDSAVTVNEGQTATNAGTVSDADGDTVMLSASVGVATNHGDGTWSWSFSTSDGPAQSQVVTITADDGDGGTTQTTFDVTVNNVSPTSDPGADQTVFRNDVATVSGTWSDPAGSFDNPYSWSWDLDGDGTADSSGTASFGDSIPETASFALEGFYTLSFEVTDKDGDGGSDSLVVEVLNRPLVCSDAAPSIATLWPTNHRFVAIDVLGVTDPEGDPVRLPSTAFSRTNRWMPPGAAAPVQTAGAWVQLRLRCAPSALAVATVASTTSTSRLMMDTVEPALERCSSACRRARGARRSMMDHWSTRRTSFPRDRFPPQRQAPSLSKRGPGGRWRCGRVS